MSPPQRENFPMSLSKIAQLSAKTSHPDALIRFVFLTELLTL